MSTHEPVLTEIPDVQYAREENIRESGYFWDNSPRVPGRSFVIQQTVGGSAYFKSGARRRAVPEGKAMLFRHGEDSRYGCDSTCLKPYRFRWVQVTDAPGVRELFDRIRTEFGPVVRMDGQGEAGRMLRQFVEDESRGTKRDRLFHAESAYRLLVAVYREQMAERRGKDPVSYGRYLLETQYRSPRNLKEWAEEVGISREHFTREFRKRYGESPAGFLRSLRLEHARLLLAGAHLSLEDIAASSGFASVQTFRRAYRSRFGVPAGSER